MPVSLTIYWKQKDFIKIFTLNCMKSVLNLKLQKSSIVLSSVLAGLQLPLDAVGSGSQKHLPLLGWGYRISVALRSVKTRLIFVVEVVSSGSRSTPMLPVNGSCDSGPSVSQQILVLLSAMWCTDCPFQKCIYVLK